MSEKDLKKVAEDVAEYPGAALDSADDEKVKERLVKERTKTLDDNPRDNN